MKHYWVEPICQALVSGNFHQIRRALHTPQGYCCLGVTCEVVLKDDLINLIPWNATERSVELEPFSCFELHGEAFGLPVEVQKEIGFLSSSGRFDLGIGMRGTARCNTSLTDLNDEGFTFAQIADVIRYFWKEL